MMKYFLFISFVFFTTSGTNFCRANNPIEDPVMAAGALIDVAKYVGSLTFQVWVKMQKIVKYSEFMLFGILERLFHFLTSDSS